MSKKTKRIVEERIVERSTCFENNPGEKSMCGKTYKFCVKSVLTKIDSIELPDFEFCALLGCVTGTTDGGKVVAE